ncbi:MAG: thioredoxin domain-containing protein [Cytophagales bacterium]|nr:MAG: thioredoxin domain-containing protein [Cytophagales bacterium]
MLEKKTNTPNRLIHSTSPYLLQHAHNPVDWFPWSEEALQKAQDEDKPIIVSIGYSACHWCHVMEKESFENEQIAAIMNQYFICIKVDREERPDIDAIYMDAVAAMGQRGGWPLHAFLTPEAKPFYAGTYFPPDYWAKLLVQIAKVFEEQRPELEKSAQDFNNTIAKSEIEKYKLERIEAPLLKTEIEKMFETLAQDFDTQKGGMKKAPKFPMPAIYQFILHYYFTSQNNNALKHLENSLDAMAAGGIYDQIGGGFARYSVDENWFAPHFEKMLYDNAQLISLYTNAYALTRKERYKDIVYSTIGFVLRELTNNEGAFYAALDADSEGIEGKFYVWTAKELQQIITPEDYPTFADYYQVTSEGNWEHGYNILHTKPNAVPPPILEKYNKQLHQIREKRPRPHTDTKIITSWNALMLKALCEAYGVFGETFIIEAALKNAHFMVENLCNGENTLQHIHKTPIKGFLEDYATVIDAFIALYEITTEAIWLQKARTLADYCLSNFYDSEEKLFFFTDTQSEKLIARKKEIFDNVIPASNSILARALYHLGIITNDSTYANTSTTMLNSVRKILNINAEYLCNWAVLYIEMCYGLSEVVIIGNEYDSIFRSLQADYHPIKIIIGQKKPPQTNDPLLNLALFEHRTFDPQKTTIYVCKNQICQLPTTHLEDAKKQLKQNIS